MASILERLAEILDSSKLSTVSNSGFRVGTPGRSFKLLLKKAVPVYADPQLINSAQSPA